MSRLIDADEFKLENKRLLHCDFPYLSEVTLEELIDDAPTVDAVPVKHGHWINSGYACGETDWECSVCHCHEWRTSKTEYCMRCGAKMDEVTE